MTESFTTPQERCGCSNILQRGKADNIRRIFIAYNKKEIIEKDFNFLADFCKGNNIYEKIADLEKSYYKTECEFIGCLCLED